VQEKNDAEEGVPEDPEEQLNEGELPSKEYDYLLTMQIMSLTEERVIEL